MSLLTNYEGLRHQIERLVRENEELKKLVRLIRENHQLKTAIKTQAGALGITGFSSALGETTASSSPRQGIFLPPSPAATNDAILEDLGLLALAPLNEVLSSSQPDALNVLLSGSTSLPLSSTLDTSLLPSTGTITPSSPMAGHMMSPPGGTLASPLPGPLSMNSPLLHSTMAPISLNSSLLTLGNIVLPEVPRLRLAEHPRAPNVSVSTVPTPTPKGPSRLSVPPPHTEHLQQNQELENITVTLGVPVQTSSPMYPTGTAGPRPSFYSTSECRPSVAQQGQAAPAPVPAPPPVTVPHHGPTPAPQEAPQASPSSTSQKASHLPAQPSPSAHAPPWVPHAPPLASSIPVPVPDPGGARASVPGPGGARASVPDPGGARASVPDPGGAHASVPDPGGARASDAGRKSVLDVERKLSPRKVKAAAAERGREPPKQQAWERLVGEIAFQLDRRILSAIFPERARLYGYTVSNIPEKIIQASLNPQDHRLDKELCHTLTQRYVNIMNRLQGLGYNGRVHPALTEQLVNAYGILRERPELAASEGSTYTVEFLQQVLLETVHPSLLNDALLLLSCLSHLAHEDGKPMFIW